MSRDLELTSRDIYLRGMQLSFQYLEGGQNSIIFKKFQQKYSRKYYDELIAKKEKRQTEGPTKN